MRSRLKVLHVTNAYPTERTPAFGIFIKEQIESVTDKGVDVEVAFINGREKGFLEYVREPIALAKGLSNYDIVHCHHILTALPILMIPRRPPVVVSYMNRRDRQIQGLSPRLVERISRWTELRASGRIFKDEIPREWEGDPATYLIPNGVNSKLFTPVSRQWARRQLGLDPDGRYALFVSFYDLHRPQKRYDRYRATLDILRNHHGLNVRELHLVGERRDRVPLWFNAADLLLVTSDYEGSPNSVKEALSCNTPIVSTNVGNVAEMLSGVPNCFVVENRDPEVLAEACLRVFNRPQRIDIRHALDQQRLRDVDVAERIIAVYQQVTKHRIA